VKDFVDLRGTSGAVYRFRLAPDGVVTTPMAGNYALVRLAPAGPVVESVAATNDLSGATATFRRSKTPGVRLYTRLNVSAAVREAERQDIAAFYAPKGQRSA